MHKVSRCSSCDHPKSQCLISCHSMTSGSLPVFVVEDHNEVLPYLYRAIGSKKIPFSNGAIIHFDSHPDLMIPSKFDCSRIHDKSYVYSALSIENWIMPAVFAKHISAIAWIKPFWANQLPEGLHTFKVGIHHSSREMKVTCSQPYFVGELAWAREKDLDATSDVILEVLTLNSPMKNEGALNEALTSSDCDEKPCKSANSSKCSLSDYFQNYLHDKPYVLDIDLDFFSTCNPFLELFTPGSLQILSSLCHYEHPSNNEDEAALEAATLKRKQQIAALERDFTKMNESSVLSSHCENEPIKMLFHTLKSEGCTTDPEMLFSAGCTCQECALPHYMCTHKQICDLVNRSQEFLSMLPKPALVTISRCCYELLNVQSFHFSAA